MRLALVVPAGLLLAGTVLLAGCGGHHDDNVGMVLIPMPSTDDPFITIVRQQTDTPAAMSEEAVPIEVAQIVATSPENTEPQAVNF